MSSSLFIRTPNALFNGRVVRVLRCRTRTGKDWLNAGQVYTPQQKRWWIVYELYPARGGEMSGL